MAPITRVLGGGPPEKGRAAEDEKIHSVGLDRVDGTDGVEKDALGVETQKQFAGRGTPSQSDDDEVGVGAGGHVDDVIGDVAGG